MHRFYAPDIIATLVLPEVESQHAVRVLRLIEGNEVEVTDGRGNLYVCRITSAHPKKCGVEIISHSSVNSHWQGSITIGIAPTKNLDRIEWMAEKTTEMGIDRIVPLLCRYSERKELKTERVCKILISAMKQSLKVTLPLLDEMTPIKKLLSDASLPEQRFIAYCDATTERRQFEACYKSDKDVVILIGPEGDFSREEVAVAIEHGFVPVTFGESRLRTETAAVYVVAACHALKHRNKGIKNNI